MSAATDHETGTSPRRKRWIAFALFLMIATAAAVGWLLSPEHDPRLVGLWKDAKQNDDIRLRLFPNGSGQTDVGQAAIKWNWTTSEGRLCVHEQGRRSTDALIELLIGRFPGLKAWHSGVGQELLWYRFSEAGSLFLDDDDDPSRSHEYLRAEPPAQ